METPTLHMHTLKIAVVDPATVPGGYSFDKVKAVLSEHWMIPFFFGTGVRQVSEDQGNDSNTDFGLDLGVGIEYIPSAVSYFERVRQIEEKSDHIVMLSGPISFLLASDDFPAALQDGRESSPPSP